VPDPAVYKGGLSEYVKKFSDDAEKTSTRVNGYIVAHISNPDGEENKRIEPALDWWVCCLLVLVDFYRFVLLCVAYVVVWSLLYGMGTRG
jgi:hypothetical protein